MLTSWICVLCVLNIKQLSVIYVISGQFKFVLCCLCPIFCSYLFTEGRAIVWHNIRATTPVACLGGAPWRRAVLSLLTMWQP